MREKTVVDTQNYIQILHESIKNRMKGVSADYILHYIN